ncbi:MAG: hypothetical protein MJZ79_06360 [Paludibacteraceae bacterium]|nr:hypothetical protein [Paludibacteraceae bacterium]
MKKLMILCAVCLMALCAMAQEINAISATQNGTTDWYPFGESNRIDVILDDLGNPIIEGKTYDLTNGNVETAFGTAEDIWFTIREGMTAGRFGTLCWNYNLTDIEGAELYRVTGKENNLISLEEVLASETQAGAGYVILATAETLRVKNGTIYAEEPRSSIACNGLQGTFVEIVDGDVGATGNILEGNYVIYNNEWRLCAGYTGLHANYAYLVMKDVPGTVEAPTPGRKHLAVPLPKETPTELESVDGSQCTMHNGKFLRNGQLIIVKDNKMYNAQGVEL